MFEKIKVLVVDDSAFMRKMISDMINSQPDMEVIDTARDGQAAVEKVRMLRPDVVTLDVEMPIKNGLESLKDIKRIDDCQVIMLSSLTSEGSNITIEALRIGAFDFIQKPSGSISLDIEKVKEELLEKIRYAKNHKRKIKTVKWNEEKPAPQQHHYNKLNIRNDISAVVLGASTGGPRVLYDVITNLPSDLRVPVFVVQHMPAGFTKAFAERINRGSELHVVEASDGDIVKDNTVYIAPGGYHMLVSGGRIHLDTSKALHGVRPAVDKLFMSAADCYGSKLLAAIFTGMGRDGAEGIKYIKSLGGYTIAQDEETCTVYGMPKAAFETGCIDLVLPENKISDAIVKAVRRGL